MLQASLAASIRVILADSHRLPFASETFDRVCYFESSCYSWSLDELFAKPPLPSKPPDSPLRTEDLTDAMSTVHGQLALFRITGEDVQLSSFGERHFQPYKQLPTRFGQIISIKP